MSNRSFVLDPKPEETPPQMLAKSIRKVSLLDPPGQAGVLLLPPPSGYIINIPANPHLKGVADVFPYLLVIAKLSPEHQRFAEAMIRELARLEGIEVPITAPESQPEPLDHYIPAWQNSLGNRSFSPSTMELYLWSLERLLANVPPPLTTIAIEGYIASRRQSGVSPTAVKTDLKAAKSFFRFLYNRDIITSDPTAKIEHPQVGRVEKICPSDDEVAKFLTVLTVAKNPKAELMIFLFINTGIRFTEMATLNWGKINFESRRITVLGKGGKVRRVPIAAWLRDYLGELHKGHADDELLFPTESKKGKWDNSDANKMIARLCRRAGIKRYTCHQFRHYFATHTLRGTGEKGLKSVQEMLGHASAATTLDYYIHTDEEEIRKTHEFAPLSEGEGVLKPKEGGSHGKTN
ncbi:Tyrosine recombinase XerC [subsurface metagenome]